MIPTVVIGGYLGAGKTTLVNHLLRQASGQRIAVLVNDFGELAIDADLIEGADGAVLALAGGCVCCSFGDDLVGALEQTVARHPPPDIVLIETSGVGLPAAVARTARLASGIEVDGIVVVQDAETLLQRAQDRYVGDLVRQQLSQADLLILNKSDLVAAAAMTSMRNWLAGVAPDTPTLTVARAQVPPQLVLGLRTRRETENEHDALSHWIAPTMRGPGATDRFVSTMRHFDHPVDLPVLIAELTGKDAGVLRAKGVLTGLDGKRYLLQIVGRRVDLSRSDSRAPAAGPEHLLVIGLAAHE